MSRRPGAHLGTYPVRMRPDDLFPRTLIRNARLVPVGGRTAPEHPVDLRIRDGKVTEVAVSLEADRDEQVHDASGRWAIPGLWDAHVHMAQWSLARARLDLAGTGSATEGADRVRREVARRAREGDRTSVIVGYGHRSAMWPRPATVAELDAVSGEHPVILVSGDAHNGWLNSAALGLLGLLPRAGALDEDDWFPVFARLDDLPGATAAKEHAYREAAHAAAAKGVVGITDMEFSGAVREWPERFSAGLTTLRVRTAVYAAELAHVLEAGWRSGDPLGDSSGLIEMGPLKIISDGSLNTRTAYCCEPYADASAAHLEHPRGKQNTSPEQLRELVGRAHAAGLRVAVHAIGDAAVSSALDAFATTGATGSIEHAQLVRLEDLERMGRLGVVASVQPAHLLDDRDVTMACWPDRADRCFALRSMLDAGVRLAMGSDAPVAALDPWLTLAAAVHRSADGREPWHPEQAVSVAEALAASTDGQGTLGVGSRGDLVLLDADPLVRDVPSTDTAAVGARLRGLPVAATFLAGRPTWSRL